VANGWEGLVAKDEASPYVPGARAWRWVKVKHARRHCFRRLFALYEKVPVRVRTGWPGEGVEYRRA